MSKKKSFEGVAKNKNKVTEQLKNEAADKKKVSGYNGFFRRLRNCTRFTYLSKFRLVVEDVQKVTYKDKDKTRQVGLSWSLPAPAAHADTHNSTFQFTLKYTNNVFF